ncbi:ATP-dependent DNA helicase RecG [Insulibacter thermoxylanivorax]|uniref:ATP-dependent DNA helicase RecG n=1 Tax=Insulibacter thermoxylanivorax TaxID=2749268 RepID=A0A916QBP9_9BACL|nr:ATP-dependent DNA helicase RecG [Insulibacter thermoxylanivorax]GFR37787.1 ATP-dependent DNA helicase RecG [Insulibacter thermoxylanivorax]
MKGKLAETTVNFVKGVGPRRAELLNQLGIFTVQDLLEYFPFRYEDYRMRDLSEVSDGEKITVQATVYGAPYVQMYGRNKSRMVCKVIVSGMPVNAVWFNQHFLRERLRPGVDIVLTGKWDARRRQITVAESEFQAGKNRQTGRLQPVYSVSGDISQKWLRKVIKQALEQYGHLIEEVLPAELVHKHQLLSRREALFGVHYAENIDEGQAARRRMVYEELLMFQLKLQALKAANKNRKHGIAHPIDRAQVEEFIRSLPFTLTRSQQEVIDEILRDLREPGCMNRLLQGDVGSGKTVVAAAALFAVVKAGSQGALMAPTEILAEQHMRNLQRMYEPFGIQVDLLVGSMTEKQRRDVLASLQMGITDVIVGTHALIQEDVYFRRLGLVITDEQHRFGVNQRSILRRKGMDPDVLTMTATPIPRTLAITAFGDMDVSTLSELPKGRKPVKTYWVKHDMLQRIIVFMGKEMAAGRQCYVICPLIEESEKLDVQNAIDLHAQLQQAYPDFRVGLLHGRMPAAEKDEEMRKFKDAETHMLVSTTVVEVGVDVPNATVMVIYDAERFGLAQLHQLRGRVGRGEHQSYCILIADPKTEVGQERMRVMMETNDGFEVARRDLELRGPGDFFGTKQSGLPEFRFADLMSDFEILELARDDAADLIQRRDFWTSPEYAPLREMLQREKVLSGDILD